jgi:CubicO group peptidase (beta-lactamase class C family)
LVKFLEFFCGLALLSSAVASLGADVFPGIDRHVRDDSGHRSDFCANEETDMLDPDAEKYFMEVIKDPLGPTHLHFGVPKGISDPRSSVRTRNGYDINSPDATGQQLTRVISRLCLAAVAAGKSFTVAAPRQAFVWTTPGFVSLASEYEVFATIVYTTPYASVNEPCITVPLKILSNDLSIRSLSNTWVGSTPSPSPSWPGPRVRQPPTRRRG